MTAHPTAPCGRDPRCASIVGTSPIRAHHSHGNYSDAFVDVEGVVKEVHFVNPHSWIYIEVKGRRPAAEVGRSRPPASSNSSG